MAFFLSLQPVHAEKITFRDTGFQTKLVLKQNSNHAIRAIRPFRDGLLNENQGQLFFNLDQVNILNSNSEGLDINSILVDKKDFYLATKLGIFQNYRQIFSKEDCSHLEKSSKQILISCQSGVYRSDFDPKAKFKKFNWEVLANSPRQVSYFSLNKTKTQLNYAVSKLGFHIFNPHKKTWKLSNYGLGRNFQEEFKLGRYLISKDSKKKQKIYLASALGMMLSEDKGKTWINSKSGIEADPDGFYTIREVVEFQDQIFFIASTGLYYRNKASNLSWTKLSITNSKKDSYANQNFYSITVNNSILLVGNSQGEVFQISPKLESRDQNNTSNNTEVFELLKIEPRIQAVHLAALEFSGIPAGDSFKRYRRHARIRNFLPDLQTYVERDNLNYISIETEANDNLNTSSGSFDTSFDRNDIERNNTAINAGVRLNWKLGNLVFDPEINDINTSARITANVRENILTEITQLYFRRKELLVKVLNKENPSLGSKLELDELLAQLDARTGAWYSQELKKNIDHTVINTKLKEFYYDS